MRKSLFALPVAVLALASSASAVTVIDTSTAWASGAGPNPNHTLGFGNGTFNYLGNASIATTSYGQTFVAPGDSYLTSYSTKFAFNSGSQFSYRLVIAAWSDVTMDAVGTPIYESPTALTSLAGPTSVFQDVSVTVNKQLVAGTKYVAFYTTSKDAFVQGSMQIALTDTAAYAPGYFAYSSSDYDQLYIDPWTTTYTANDTVFKATFVTIAPEPGTWAALGLGAVALLRRRRK